MDATLCKRGVLTRGPVAVVAPMIVTFGCLLFSAAIPLNASALSFKLCAWIAPVPLAPPPNDVR
jgi:hypothetical protein